MLFHVVFCSRLLLLCYTVRNHAELFRDKTGVVLSGRLLEPPGFVDFIAGFAPVFHFKCTDFDMQIRRRSVLCNSIRSAHHMTVLWCFVCRISRGSLCLNVNGERSFLRIFKGQQIGMYDVVSTCFSMVQCSVHCLVRLLVL